MGKVHGFLPPCCTPLLIGKGLEDEEVRRNYRSLLRAIENLITRLPRPRKKSPSYQILENLHEKTRELIESQKIDLETGGDIQIMRVTLNLITAQVKKDLFKNAERLQKTQNTLTTGKRINKPSDDATGVVKAMGQRTQIGNIEQFLRNIDSGISSLDLTDSLMRELSHQLVRAKEIAISQATSTADAGARAAAALEVMGMLEETVGLTNTKFDGRFIFAGHKTNTLPFELQMSDEGMAVIYHGDDGKIQRQIGIHTTTDINVAAPEMFNKIFETFIGLRDALENNDLTAIEASLFDLDESIEVALNTSADVGAKMNRLERTSERLLDMKNTAIKTLSDIEDANLAETITDFTLQQTALQASLESASRIMQLSLMDFLR